MILYILIQSIIQMETQSRNQKATETWKGSCEGTKPKPKLLYFEHIRRKQDLVGRIT